MSISTEASAGPALDQSEDQFNVDLGQVAQRWRRLRERLQQPPLAGGQTSGP